MPKLRQKKKTTTSTPKQKQKSLFPSPPSSQSIDSDSVGTRARTTHYKSLVNVKDNEFDMSSKLYSVRKKNNRPFLFVYNTSEKQDTLEPPVFCGWIASVSTRASLSKSRTKSTIKNIDDAKARTNHILFTCADEQEEGAVYVVCAGNAMDGEFDEEKFKNFTEEDYLNTDVVKRTFIS